ncbi:leucyl aminopeptidase family protein [Corynebacterium macclintockiae]|uniref:leucyl aminopeptidase family protein n=1 Tax=Corynebacterium macclintockiae TaxID=2913501 RepID=UPI00254E2FC7|nr:leucyl aminopeptidase family protein [Corynebacterium macclintockiae]MDK8891274.1 leucyl aminopeptidase family protein [Corynebacterium macclintockiae]
MAPIPNIPQKVTNVTIGPRAEGSEIIETEIKVAPGQVAPGDVELDASGRWAAWVPAEPTRPLDLSDGREFLEDGWRGAGAKLVRRIGKVVDGHPVRAKKHIVQVNLPAEFTPDNVRSLVIGLIVGNHSFVTTNKRKPARVRNVHVVLPEGYQFSGFETSDYVDAVQQGAALGKATCLSRDLANAPANVKSPEWLANQAKQAVAGLDGVKVRLRDAGWLEDKGFGGILAVGRGSSRPPMLIELVWDPQKIDKPRRRTVVLVGKGVTFDTGGISVKPAAGMDTMRTDMTGGASVIAAFRALAEQQVPRKIVALIPTAENMIDGKSYRPGDVVEHYGGLTSEVTNTDAEGRMILADAISYGAKKYKPTAVVTIATLTGAAKLALGTRTGAVFSDNWGAGVKLARRGATVGENWWPMPMQEYLEDNVTSKIADVRQTPKGPGATTAAMFLRRFTRDLPLIHLDIAGPGRAESTYDEVTPVGTGFGARTLVQWLLH